MNQKSFNTYNTLNLNSRHSRERERERNFTRILNVISAPKILLADVILFVHINSGTPRQDAWLCTLSYSYYCRGATRVLYSLLAICFKTFWGFSIMLWKELCVSTYCIKLFTFFYNLINKLKHFIKSNKFLKKKKL